MNVIESCILVKLKNWFITYRILYYVTHLDLSQRRETFEHVKLSLCDLLTWVRAVESVIDACIRVGCRYHTLLKCV